MSSSLPVLEMDTSPSCPTGYYTISSTKEHPMNKLGVGTFGLLAVVLAGINCGSFNPCGGGQQECADGTCAPSSSVCCGGGTSCPAGSTCGYVAGTCVSTGYGGSSGGGGCLSSGEETCY